MTPLTRKYRERIQAATEEFQRGYYHAQFSQLLRVLSPEDLKDIARIFRTMNNPYTYGLAKACEDAARQAVTA